MPFKMYIFAKRSPLRKSIFLSALLLSTLCAEETTLRGVLLLNAREQLLQKEELIDIHGVGALGVQLPGSLEELTAVLEPLYLDQPIESAQVQKIKQAVTSYYESKESPFVLVLVPEQNITDGILQLLVVNATVGNIAAAPAVQKYLRTEVGDEIQTDLIAQDIDLMNRNPFRSSKVVYSPGEAPGTTDVSIVTEEKRPYKVYTGVNNNGVVALQNSRLYSGLSVGNLFNQDHTFAFEYTTSGNFSQLQSFKADYTAPLPWRHVLHTRVGYSGTHATTADLGINMDLHTRGNSYIANIDYTIPFSTANWKREVKAGVLFKNTNSEQEYENKIVKEKSDVNMFQLMAETAFGLKKERYEMEWVSTVCASPGPFLPRQENSEYDKLRPGTTATWVYGKGQWKYKQKMLTSCLLSLQLTSQLSFTKLLPSEQMGLGGADTVRGYQNRKVNLDESFLGNLEFYLPSFEMVSAFFPQAPKDEVKFFAFIDSGWGFEVGPSSRPLISNLLLSAGPALRYKLGDYLSVKLDWGVRLHNETAFTVEPGIAHLSAVASY